MTKFLCAFVCLVIFQSCSKSSSNPNGGGGGGAPSISAMSYLDGIIGDTVKITGLNFSTTSSDNTVEFNGVKATVVSSTSSSIICIVPPGTTTGNVTVTVNGQAASNSKLFTVVSVNVFTAGNNSDGNGLVFRNGVVIETIKELHPVYLTNIYVSGSDVYVCGKGFSSSTGNQIIAYWKNGSETDLTTGSSSDVATSIWVSGNDVYVTGDDGTGVLKYWKNGTPVILINQTYIDASTSSIFVSGSDVYTTGMYYSSNTAPTVGAYWKNGVQVKLTTSNPAADILNNLPMFVSGTDVYVAGTLGTFNLTHDTVKYQAVYWKNGAEFDLGQPGDGTMANGIYVSGSDVYAAGYQLTANTYIPGYWKNSNMVALPQSQGAMFGITGDGSNTYMVGFTLSSNTRIWGYWMNDVFNSIPSNINLASLSGIFLQKAP